MIRIFLSENFQFFVVKCTIYLNRRVFVMYTYLFQDQDQDHPSLLAVLSVPRRWSNRGLKQTTHLFTITLYFEAGVPNGMCMGENKYYPRRIS